MKYQHFVMGHLQTNGFILYDDKNAVVVDPGGEVSAMRDFLDKNGLTVSMILNTHLHFDHTFGNALLAEGGAKIYASKEDTFLLDDKSGQGGKWGFPVMEPYEFEDLKPCEIDLLDTKCRVLRTPGHTPGGLSFYFPAEKVVFVGDSLFAGSIGRTDFPRGDLQTLLGSIHKELYTLPEDTTAWPGHGPSTTIGKEKSGNPFNDMYQGG